MVWWYADRIPVKKVQVRTRAGYEIFGAPKPSDFTIPFFSFSFLSLSDVTVIKFFTPPQLFSALFLFKGENHIST